MYDENEHNFSCYRWLSLLLNVQIFLRSITQETILNDDISRRITNPFQFSRVKANLKVDKQQ